jgi:hypothetical protein
MWDLWWTELSWAGFLNTLVFPASFHSTDCPTLIIIIIIIIIYLLGLLQ